MAESFLLVTGASSGIGRSYALELAKRGGHSLLLVGRDADKLGETRDAVQAYWRVRGQVNRTEVLVCDLAEVSLREKLLKEIDRAGWRVDGVFHCASTSSWGDFTKAPYEVYRRLIEINCQAPVHLAHYALPGMLKRRQGEIVVLASRWAFLSAPYLATYAASKSFLLRWAQGLAAELSGTGVQILVQCPGHTATESSAQRPRIWSWLPARLPEQVATNGLRALAAKRTLQVDGWITNTILTMARFVPSRLANLFLRRVLKG